MKFKITEVPVKETNGWKDFYFYKWKFRVERAEWYAFLFTKTDDSHIVLFSTKEEAEKYIHAQLNPTYYP